MKEIDEAMEDMDDMAIICWDNVLRTMFVSLDYLQFIERNYSPFVGYQISEAIINLHDVILSTTDLEEFDG